MPAETGQPAVDGAISGAPGPAAAPISAGHAQGRALAESGHLPAARVLLDQALAEAERQMGRDSPELAPLMIDLAVVEQMLGRLGDARVLLRRAYAILVGSGGAESPQALSAEGRLAAVTHQLGELTEAYDWHLHDVGRRVLGPDHPAVRGAEQRLAAGTSRPLDAATSADAVGEEPTRRAPATPAPPAWPPEAPAWPPMPAPPAPAAAPPPPVPASAPAAPPPLPPGIELRYESAGYPGVYQRSDLGQPPPDLQRSTEADGLPPEAGMPAGGHLIGQPEWPPTRPDYPPASLPPGPPQLAPGRPDQDRHPLESVDGRPGPQGRHAGGKILVASLVVALLLAGCVIADQFFGPFFDEPDSAEPTAAADAIAGTSASPTAHPGFPTPGPPTDLSIKDSGGTVMLTWRDPSHGTISFFISGGRADAQPKALGTANAGHTSLVISGLSDRYDYCFTVSAVWGQDLILASEQACTTRFGTGSPTASRSANGP